MASGEIEVPGVANGSAITPRTESFNQVVRALVVLALTAGFIYGFIVSKVVSTESFAIVFGIAMTWWFKSRDESKPTPPTKPTATGAAL